MRLLTAAVVLVAAAPAVAGPLDALQFRSSLSTDLPPAAGPAHQPGDVAHLLWASASAGVVTGGAPGWTPVAPVHPGAGFAVLRAGGFTPFVAALSPDHAAAGGTGRYYLNLGFRDGAGRSAEVLFAGRFEAGWWGGHGYAGPLYDYQPSPPGAGAPPMPIHPTATLWLGRSRYDLRLDYGWPPDYAQNEDGTWGEVWHAADSIPQLAGGYWTEPTGGFLLTLTPVQTPEPGSLALVLAGVGAAGFARRMRR